uniref:Reverse transcriptase n=1 Tax=Solanum tuberosum TaxID=4113 RepID=M1DPU8_SOLTU
MSLHDLYLTEALKIHVQIVGAPQARDAIQATLHYQLAWRLQNHVMDLSLPGGQDALFLNVDATNRTTQCTQIPRKDNLDSESISDFFGNDLDWIKEFGHDGLGVFWYKCPFTRHIPWDIDCNCTECEEDYYGSEDDDEVDYDEYSYDRAKWDGEEYQFLVSHKPQDWPALPTP